MLKNVLPKLKFISYQNQWYHTKLCFNINLTMRGLPSNMKSSSHETWQTSLLFLKPLQMQNLKRKKWGGHGILCPPRLKKWGDTSPVSPTKLRPCSDLHNYYLQISIFSNYTMLVYDDDGQKEYLLMFCFSVRSSSVPTLHAPTNSYPVMCYV